MACRCAPTWKSRWWCLTVVVRIRWWMSHPKISCHNPKIPILGCEYISKYNYSSSGYSENFFGFFSQLFSFSLKLNSLNFQSTIFFFHEIQIFYLDFSCPKLSPRFSIEFLGFAGYIFIDLKIYLDFLDIFNLKNIFWEIEILSLFFRDWIPLVLPHQVFDFKSFASIKSHSK
jgi:hypothetical protein